LADLRHDPQSGRWVAIAPVRANRPGHDAPVDGSCPFCAGNEHLTPPETLRLGDGPTGWAVRVVPNLYPALERQEVVVHGPHHVETLADLPAATIDLVAEAWQRRARETDGNCFPFLNEGAAAGASQTHSHSQLAWLPEPLVVRGPLPEFVPVLERDGLVAGCPVAGRAPYELVIAPERPEPAGLESELLAPALRLLAELIGRLGAVHDGPVPVNAWLHDGEHWRLELLPRTTRFAGLEFGADVFIHDLTPEQAAARLRGGA
jgi:UDPglucose--hexose-1-phosphate uridylyltransferase